MQENLPSSRSLITGIWRHLSKRRKLQVGGLVIVMSISAIAELITVGALVPFLTVITNQRELNGNEIISFLSDKSSRADSEHTLIIQFTLILATTIAIAAAVKLLTLKLNTTLAAKIGSDLSIKAYKKTIFQQYQVHTERNSSGIITSISTQISLTVGALNALLQMNTAIAVTIALTIGLVIANWKIAITITAIIGVLYWRVAKRAKKALHQNSQKITSSYEEQMRALQEGLGGIREVILEGSQYYYLNKYGYADILLRQLEANNLYLGAFPKYVIEAAGIITIIALGALLTLSGANSSDVIATLGIVAVGSQKLLPALQQIFASWATIKGSTSAIKKVLESLDQSINPTTEAKEPLKLEQKISFNNVQFRYRKGGDIIQRMSFEIKKGEKIGIVGGTGSGKTTTLDLLIGLLKPTGGEIFIDSQCISCENTHELRSKWLKNISYVPQSVYLTDSSIAENIAFGEAKKNISIEKVMYAARVAQIAEFIEQTQHGYETKVGERGVQLSGGQRQRIGIARALYKSAQVLVLDEATSALDNATEKNVMRAIGNLDKDLTVIMIAHRISSLFICSRVLKIENGIIAREMTVDELHSEAK